MEPRAEWGLRRYIHAVAAGLGLGPESTWCELDVGARAYVALENRLPWVPDRDAALVWNASHGWAVGVEYGGAATVLALSYRGAPLLPSPGDVVAFVKKAFAGVPVGSASPSELDCPDLRRQLERYASAESCQGLRRVGCMAIDSGASVAAGCTTDFRW
ncbi:hypothetical protein FB384_001179 [Prauserella sediminis]|uniref:DUF6292 domain-containing protein n=1 Tax=Prauserella sediminis TaxID=577680 RepID=A0A839XQT2_9PSEU|nr:DUF6292 family protein [Prauserella sediminis]MBB3662275.1 hypothetical protein [Prauserella sediminis]